MTRSWSTAFAGRRTRPGHAFLLALGLVALLVPPAIRSTTPAAAVARCAWPLLVSATDTNVYWPDTAAAYWTMPYQVHDGMRITVSGLFPDARYISLNVYDATSASFTTNGVSSTLPDYRIAPDVGSANPWQQRVATGGSFTVTVSGDAAPGEANTLPLAPAGTADGAKASLIYRVYLPAGGDFGAVPLPTVTITQAGQTTVLTACQRATAASPAAGASAAVHPGRPGGPGDDHGADVPPVFARTSDLGNAAPNGDNAYLGAWITPPGPDTVVVIRARAPRSVRGNHPVPWPARGAEVRYWSMCTNLRDPSEPVVVNALADGSLDYGCRYDDNTALDRDGYYTFVLGTEDQRAAVEAAGRGTFLPFSSDSPGLPHLVLLRNLLAVDGFAHAVQRVPMDSPPATARSIMGDFYPEVYTCSLAAVAGAAPIGVGVAPVHRRGTARGAV